MTDRFLITTKTKKQYEVVKAFTSALNIDTINLDKFESQEIGKLIEKCDKGDLLSPEEQESLFKILGRKKS